MTEVIASVLVVLLTGLCIASIILLAAYAFLICTGGFMDVEVDRITINTIASIVASVVTYVALYFLIRSFSWKIVGTETFFYSSVVLTFIFATAYSVMLRTWPPKYTSAELRSKVPRHYLLVMLLVSLVFSLASMLKD